MDTFKEIQAKLEQFIRRYYTNELLKGAILFFTIGILYFMATLLIEHFLWLNSVGRTILFWLFISVEVILFVKFIAFPIAQLFKLKKGIDYKVAAVIIGNHFPEVSDKLLNALQLDAQQTNSELLLAGIAQKSAELSPIPFKLAINFKNNIKYLKYAAIPIIIILLIVLSGHFNWFSDSYKRVVNYQTAYEPPAPFQFFVINETLSTLENQDFKLIVKTVGEIVPENATIQYNDETYFLTPTNTGSFQYIFTKPQENIAFRLSANAVHSKPYILQITKVPTILDFEMALDYPAYTNKSDEILKSTGSATIPQGTTVTWRLKTKQTEAVYLFTEDTITFNNTEKAFFKLTKRVFKPLDYTLSTSNKAISNYENLAFRIDVIRDNYPEIDLEMKTDTIDNRTLYFYGKVTDDYALSKLQLVYYPVNNISEKQIQDISVSKSNFDTFISAFPNQLNLEAGKQYDLYFEVFDNDAVNGIKSTKSSVFSFREPTKDEVAKEQLEQQNATIQNFNKSLNTFEAQQKTLEELSKTQKEKEALNYNDKKKLEQFIKRQAEQDQLLKQFNKQLQENLEKVDKDKPDDSFKEALKERLKDNEKQLQQNEQLLKELQALQEKIDKAQFSEKLEQLAKQNKSQERSLEQLLELTKRYYIGKKLEQLQQNLSKQSELQEQLAKASEEANTKAKQDSLNKEFKEFQKAMEQLREENKALQKPMNLPNDKVMEQEINALQKESSEQLEKKASSPSESQQQQAYEKAKQAQQRSALRMKEMSQQMQQGMQMLSGEQLEEDIKMLRQILDNLLVFSFDEEDLLIQFKSIDVNHNEYATYLRKQNTLREHFEHVDDSLFALSLRQPMISKDINKEIADVYFYIDKALSQFSENQMFQGVSSQQYTITAANNLANLLSSSLNSMQMQMEGQGQGSGKGKSGQGQDGQLPDIIMSQEELNKMMEEGLKQQGKQEGKGQENKGKEGENGKDKNAEKAIKSGNKNGSGSGQKKGNEESDEFLKGELYKIYQEQQQLREALENRLEKDGLKEAARNLLQQAEQIEEDLLNKGFTNETLQKMQEFKHQLLKLENATNQQGKDTKKQSNVNDKTFDNETNNKLPEAKNYFNTIEILNREALPLQYEYKQKLQDYYKHK